LPYDGTFWTLACREDVADSECGFLACVNEGASVETFGCDESVFPKFVVVWVTENDTGKRSTTAIITIRISDSKIR
jgi:hypothetical protein